jgi:uncharacterized protein YdeI (YjbR/CyaY-like superfamily)
MAEKLRSSMGFRDARELGDWLAEHHHSSSELWVQIFKAGSGRPSVTWTDCVVEAIRFGWIDGQKQPHDAASFLQRLTPRKPKSNWSARNREHATRLIAEGRMTPAGLAHVDAAKADGRWHLYPIYYRLQTAKRPETRAKRMAQILAQLERGERFH